MNKFLPILIILVFISVSIGSYLIFFRNIEEAVEEKIVPVIKMTAIIQTNFGDIKIELFADDAPKTVENFIKLAKEGFYDGIRFHRVIQRFMIQAGCPFSRDIALKDRWGTGGPGWIFEDEIHEDNHNVVGTISMANAGPNTNGSQFFINLADNNFLDNRHTVFGRVIEGMEVVNAIGKVETGPGDRPVEDVIIESIKVDKK
ncbi:MAG: peptidylprolyl isomerase [Candidatus Nealsonbacteria bacterium]|nr:peptidylprolyl isomerase [Candidatus Nealsonbacteria bacterium]